jgi:hypothetical protein
VSYASARARARATWIAALLAPLVALGGAAVPATSAAAAAAGPVATASVCTVTDAELVWGFKESFRAYIDGAIANGEWTTTGNASYDTPLFTWSGGAGDTDADGALTVRFSAAVRFTGHGGILDTTVENPRIVIDGDTALLLLDVHGTTQAGDAVDASAVEFAELDLAAADRTRDGDALTVVGIPAVLTEAGAAAFGTYDAGETLDPITLTATVDGECGVFADGWPVWATVLITALAAVAAALALVAALVWRRRSLSA